MKIDVLMPWRDTGCPYRKRSHDYVHAWWVERGFTPIEADDAGPVFSRGRSLNVAVGRSDADVFVVTDTDVIVGFDKIMEAVELAAVAPGLVQAHDRYDYLSKRGTEAFYNGGALHMDFSLGVAQGFLLGAMNVLSRDTYDLSGGWVASFEGWGCEDQMFAHQCEVLAGPLRRVEGSPMTHLWHPKAHDGYTEYEHANADRMAALVAITDPTEFRAAIVAAKES